VPARVEVSTVSGDTSTDATPVNPLHTLAQPDARLQARLVAVVVLLAVIGLGHELARLTWLLWPMPETQSAPTRATATAASGGASMNLSQAASLHLFGEPPAENVAETAPIDAPETNLNLQLRGILFYNEPTLTRAIIASAGKADEIYAAGDSLPGGATVDAIYPDRVILLRDGRHEALKLPEESLEDVTANTASAAGTSRATRSTGNTDGTDASASPLQRYRERLMQDPASIQRLLQPAPEMDASGNLVGFRIQGGGDPQLLQATGLRPGDVITSIAGIQLTSQQAVSEAMQRIASSQRVTLTVNRNGRQRRVLLNFSK
jgi:general secretion pathway protein C